MVNGKDFIEKKYCVAFQEAWSKNAVEIGLKGCGIADMYRMGIPVPDGFIINTSLCWQYFRMTKAGRKRLMEQVSVNVYRELQKLEMRTGKKLSGSKNGLVLSVRSGAAVSMPGILTTYCNITNKKQLADSIEKVLLSWESDRAKAYREQCKISEDYGTAVIVQQMVNGMASELSGTGVCYTRNPSTGQNELFGEFLPVAQGEQLVGGRTIPYRLQEMKRHFKDQYEELVRYAKMLENHYHAMQEIEFTIEEGSLYILQTRKARCSQFAQKVMRREAGFGGEADGLLSYMEIVEKEEHAVLEEGIPLGIGDISGKAAYTLEAVNKWKEAGESVIFICEDMSIENIEAFFKADGIISATGGVTSHAASLALGAGKRCITACRSIDLSHGLHIGGKEIKEGDVLTLDMQNGRIYEGLLRKCVKTLL